VFIRSRAWTKVSRSCARGGPDPTGLIWKKDMDLAPSWGQSISWCVGYHSHSERDGRGQGISWDIDERKEERSVAINGFAQSLNSLFRPNGEDYKGSQLLKDYWFH